MARAKTTVGACEFCGTEHGQKQACRFPRVTHALLTPVTHAQFTVDGSPAVITGKSSAARVARWRKANPDKHAEQQRRHRASQTAMKCHG